MGWDGYYYPTPTPTSQTTHAPPPPQRRQGYGFIEPTQAGGPDVFVHQSEIRRDGFRFLIKGESVEYLVEEAGGGKRRALNVTGKGDGRMDVLWGGRWAVGGRAAASRHTQSLPLFAHHIQPYNTNPSPSKGPGGSELPAKRFDGPPSSSRGPPRRGPPRRFEGQGH